MPKPVPVSRTRSFLLQRILEERRAASQATCTEARFAHRELARCYAAEARAARRPSDSPPPKDEGAVP